LLGFAALTPIHYANQSTVVELPVIWSFSYPALTSSIKQSVKLLVNERLSSYASQTSNSPSRQRSPWPSEAKARSSAQLVCAPQATFFREFLFCQKRKLPPAGEALGLKPKTEHPKPEARKN